MLLGVVLLSDVVQVNDIAPHRSVEFRLQHRELGKFGDLRRKYLRYTRNVWFYASFGFFKPVYRFDTGATKNEKMYRVRSLCERKCFVIESERKVINPLTREYMLNCRIHEFH